MIEGFLLLDLPICKCIAGSVIVAFIAIVILTYVKVTITGACVSNGTKKIVKLENHMKDLTEWIPKNLLRNNCGQEEFQHWEVLRSGGDGWTVEEKPVGVEEVPVMSREGIPISDFGEYSSCFATSYGLSEKIQLVDLVKEGFSPDKIDTVQPSIEVSEWYACRIVSDSIYELTVKLLDERKNCMSEFTKKEDLVDSPKESWQKVTHTFKNYGPGVRYVSFCHGGGDSRKLPGHYGCKIGGGVVKVLDFKNSIR